MPITWTDTASFTAQVLTPTHLNNIRSDLESKFNAGIVTADLSSTAGITTGQLASNNAFIPLPIVFHSDDAAGTPGLAATGLVAHAPITAPGGNDTYTIVGVEVSCNDVGALTGVIKFQYGTFSAGAWSGTDFTGNLTLDGTNGATGNDGSRYSVTPTVTSFDASTNPVLGMVCVTADATCCSAPGSTLVSTVLLKRVLTEA